MIQHSPKEISDLLVDFLRENGLEKPLLERQVVQAWPIVMGNQVARFTDKLEIKDGVLFVYLHSAALKTQLFECRFQIVAKMNNYVGAQILKDIRLLG